MNFFIFTKSTFNGNEHQDMLSAGYKLSAAHVKQLGGKKKALEYMKSQISAEKLKSLFDEENTLGSTFVSAEIVTVTQGKWIGGEYYAHEYDEYTDGRARALKYSNGFKECEVQCLDDSKSVMDGIWELDETASGRVNNGCGDHFTPNETIK